MIERLKLDMKKIPNARGKSCSQASILQYLVLLRRLFNIAIKWGLYDGNNPMSRVTLPRVNNNVTNVLDALNKNSDCEVANLIKLLLFTGMRRGEAFKLAWNDVDLKRGWIRLRSAEAGK